MILQRSDFFLHFGRGVCDTVSGLARPDETHNCQVKAQAHLVGMGTCGGFYCKCGCKLGVN